MKKLLLILFIGFIIGCQPTPMAEKQQQDDAAFWSAVKTLLNSTNQALQQRRRRSCYHPPLLQTPDIHQQHLENLYQRQLVDELRGIRKELRPGPVIKPDPRLTLPPDPRWWIK